MRNLPKGQNTDGLSECSSGIPKMIEYGTLFGLTLLASYLDTKQNEGSHVKIHAICQKNIGNSIRKTKANPENSEKHYKVAKIATRSSIEGFNWEEQCFFCGKEFKEDKKHPEKKRPSIKKIFKENLSQTTFLHYRETILKILIPEKKIHGFWE